MPRTQISWRLIPPQSLRSYLLQPWRRNCGENPVDKQTFNPYCSVLLSWGVTRARFGTVVFGEHVRDDTNGALVALLDLGVPLRRRGRTGAVAVARSPTKLGTCVKHGRGYAASTRSTTATASTTPSRQCVCELLSRC